MKAEELMIGDWVQNASGTIKGKIINIDSYKNRIEFDAHTIDIDYVYPIPLTKEIFEKNGFTISFIDNEPVLQYSLYKDNIGDFDLYILNGFRKGSICGEEYEYQFTAIQYVHELQHALKLRKIEKKIIL